MSKIYIILALLTVSFTSFSKEIVAKWNFHTITSDSSKNSENIKVISNSDAMYINMDGSFNYEIKKPVGMPQKLLDSNRLLKFGWTYKTDLDNGIRYTYDQFFNKGDR